MLIHNLYMLEYRIYIGIYLLRKDLYKIYIIFVNGIYLLTYECILFYFIFKIFILHIYLFIELLRYYLIEYKRGSLLFIYQYLNHE